jgi:hypothetical protein
MLPGVSLRSDTLQSGDGPPRNVVVQSILEDGTILDAAGNDVGHMSRLERLERSSEMSTASGAVHRVWLDAGSELIADSLSLQDETLEVGSPLGIALVFPLRAVAGLRMACTNASATCRAWEQQWREAMDARAPDYDRIFLITGERIQPLSVVLEAIEGESVRFTWGGNSRSVPASRIFGATLARASQPLAEEHLVRVACTDGSVLKAEVLGLQEGRLRLRVAGTAQVVEWSHVRSIAAPRGGVRFLSELEPTTVETASLVTAELPWQRDRSAAGEPLVVAGIAFSRGLGVHAVSRLTFPVGSGDEAFAASVGVDDAGLAARGDCEFVVLADGQERARVRARAGEPPHPVRVPLEGVREITLVVEAGANLDLGDYANWCDARFEPGRNGR